MPRRVSRPSFRSNTETVLDSEPIYKSSFDWPDGAPRLNNAPTKEEQNLLLVTLPGIKSTQICTLGDSPCFE
jgi:hypothetical protein